MQLSLNLIKMRAQIAVFIHPIRPHGFINPITHLIPIGMKPYLKNFPPSTKRLFFHFIYFQFLFYLFLDFMISLTIHPIFIIDREEIAYKFSSIEDIIDNRIGKIRQMKSNLMCSSLADPTFH